MYTCVYTYMYVFVYPLYTYTCMYVCNTFACNNYLKLDVDTHTCCYNLFILRSLLLHMCVQVHVRIIIVVF